MSACISIIRLVCCLAACATSAVGALAQGEKLKSSYYENLNPATPEKAGFGAFGNTKINHYTGLPEVKLDLFTLQGRDFSLPISISYDASGVRTDDLSGPVGMKWNLDGGGFVFRELVGLPDEHPDRGYFRFAKETSYYTSLNPADWASKCENNEWDCAPDIYSININGRMIRFFFDQNKVAHTIPRQNIRILYTLISSTDPNQVRIGKFEVTTEDGIKYIFGGTPESIEERKVEKFVIRTSFWYNLLRDCPYTPFPPTDPAPTASFYCQSGFQQRFDATPETSVKTNLPYNMRWHLRSIILPSGETTSFTYSKLADVKYAVRPSSILIRNVMGALPFYQEKLRRCIGSFAGICYSEIEETFHYYYPAAVLKLGKTNPGSDPMAYSLPDPATFPPTSFTATPGNVTFYHALITESNIRLDEIKSATGNRVVFSSSLREDLPNSIKYDRIALYNLSNQLVQARTLNYSVIESDESNDYFWFSEALLLKHLQSTKQEGPYWANYFKQHVSTDILDPNFAKFVFEGVKAYNYKRTFLASIDDTSDPTISSRLYGFNYSDLQFLRRRTTTYHDKNGFARVQKSLHESALITEGRIAVMSNSYDPGKCLSDGSKPLAGRLTEITYPTGGSTRFTFGILKEVRLSRIEDFDSDGRKLRERQFEYTETAPSTIQTFHSFQDFFVESQNAWMKYNIISSSPQNDSYKPTYLTAGARKTIAYDGSKDKNNGREEFVYSTSGIDTMYNDKIHTIVSIPADTNEDGTPVQEIFPFPRMTDLSHRRGLLLSHQVFSRNSSAPVSETRFEYQINPDGYKPVIVGGFKGGTFIWKTKEKTSFWYGRETEGVSRQRYARYALRADWIRLAKRTDVVYDNVTPTEKVERVTDYSYDPQHLQQVEARHYLVSDPTNKLITITRYATHSDYSGTKNCSSSYNACMANCSSTNPVDACYTSCKNQLVSCEKFVGYPERGAIQRLRDANAINVPVEIQSWREQGGNRTLISATVFSYIPIGTYFGVRKAHVKEIREPLNAANYKPSYCNVEGAFVTDSRMQWVQSFPAYDPTTHRLLSQISSDGTTETYQWAHNGSYVSQIVINPGQSEHKTSFTYNPLVGLTSLTDPNGIVSSYGYEPGGKLARAYRENELQTKYFYHKFSDTFKQTLTASITASGAKVVGQLIRFETPVEVRSGGNIEYSWSMQPKINLGAKNYAEYTFSSPGTYRVTLKKTHPEFGSAVAAIEVKISAAKKAVVCVDGPMQIDVPNNTTPIVYGDCTTVPGTSATLLKATAEGICGEDNQLTFRWELWNSSTSTWNTFSTAGSAVAPPVAFTKRFPGEYKIRCVITDGCLTQIISDTRTLLIF